MEDLRQSYKPVTYYCLGITFVSYSTVEIDALENIAAHFEKDIQRAVDIVLALPDGDHKMDLLHVSSQSNYEVTNNILYSPVPAVPAEDGEDRSHCKLSRGNILSCAAVSLRYLLLNTSLECYTTLEYIKLKYTKSMLIWLSWNFQLWTLQHLPSLWQILKLMISWDQYQGSQNTNK